MLGDKTRCLFLRLLHGGCRSRLDLHDVLPADLDFLRRAGDRLVSISGGIEITERERQLLRSALTRHSAELKGLAAGKRCLVARAELILARIGLPRIRR